MNDSADNYIRDESKYIDYDTFTEDDWLWTNEFDPLDIKNQILEKEFNYARTKYISIDTVMSMSDLSLRFHTSLIHSLMILDLKIVFVYQFLILDLIRHLSYLLSYAIYSLYLTYTIIRKIQSKQRQFLLCIFKDSISMQT